MSHAAYYAIGDVHGLADRLGALHQQIADDHARRGGEAILVHLGDYVDRGPDSRGVIDRVMAIEARPPSGMVVISLRGNHEQMMLDALSGGEAAVAHWMDCGGEATLPSYLDADTDLDAPWGSIVDPAHVAWLRRLPTLHHDAERKIAFVHGGIDPAAFPHCADEVRIWTRSARFFDRDAWPDRSELDGLLVVHGHTPTEFRSPEAYPHRINVDTGAVYGGPLTAVVLTPGEKPRFLMAR